MIRDRGNIGRASAGPHARTLNLDEILGLGGIPANLKMWRCDRCNHQDKADKSRPNREAEGGGNLAAILPNLWREASDGSGSQQGRTNDFKGCGGIFVDHYADISRQPLRNSCSTSSLGGLM